MGNSTINPLQSSLASVPTQLAMGVPTHKLPPSRRKLCLGSRLGNCRCAVEDTFSRKQLLLSRHFLNRPRKKTRRMELVTVRSPLKSNMLL